MDSSDIETNGSERMTPVRKNDSLRYFVAMIAQMAATLREFGMTDAAQSLDVARAQIEAKLSENKEAV